jgi:hypothetical protein
MTIRVLSCTIRFQVIDFFRKWRALERGRLDRIIKAVSGQDMWQVEVLSLQKGS